MFRSKWMCALPALVCVLVITASAPAAADDGLQEKIDARVARAIDEANTLNRQLLTGEGGYGRVKNVIVLVPDGCSQSVQTLARWYKGSPLTLDAMHVGVAKHEMANSVITGSAAAATAFSTGYKTSVRFLSVGPRAEDVLSTYVWPEPSATLSYRPLATVLEGAKLLGKSTGLISTSRFTHATPAAWACHSMDRGNEGSDISEHMVYNNVDLVFGGGERNLVPASLGGKRADEEDLLQVLADRGYSVVRTGTEMNTVSKLPVYGMFAWSHMDAEIDRPVYHPDEPSLADMTAKAIDLLSHNNRGFFLQVEGSQVDWAGHNNDPVWMVTDFLEFDEAVQVAVDFAKKSRNTLVLAYPDHNTGGMDIGNRDYNGAYTHLTVEELVDPLKGMTITAGALAAEIDALGRTVANIQAMALQHWNIDVDAAVAQEILDLTDTQEGQGGYTISFGYALARVMSERYTAIGWTSHGHNAADVPVWAYGKGADHPALGKGLVDNTELADLVAAVFHLDMAALNRMLFVSLDDVYTTWTLDETDPLNPVVRIDGSYASAEMPCSKDILTITTRWGKTRTFRLPGVVVHASMTNRVYVSQKAIGIMTAYGIR